MTLAKQIDTPPLVLPGRLQVSDKSQSFQPLAVSQGRFGQAALLVCASTSLLALFMGGLLWNAYDVVNLVVAASALGLLFNTKTSLQRLGRLTQSVLGGLALVGLYAAAVTLILLFQSNPEPHPVLGEVSRLMSPQRALRWLSQWAASLSLVWIVIATCTRNPKQLSLIVKLLVASGSAVAFIGIAHWFTDNGHLFWFISPQEAFVSNRLRWPFVNCDHMAAFLVMILFPTVAFAHQAWRATAHDLEQRASLASKSPGGSSRKPRSLVSRLSRLAQSPHSAKNLARAIAGVIAVVMLTVSILGTLSRTAWFAMSVGFVTYILLAVTRRTKSREVEVGIQRRTKRTSTARTVKQVSSKLVRRVLGYIPSILVGAVPLIFVVLLLQGGGGDLIETRLSGMSKTLPQDPRWTMYKDSIALLKDAPLFGIGVGQWQALHTTAADSTLAGVSIDYAHSDILQTAVELGVLGMLPLLALAGVIARAIPSIRRESDHARRRLLAGLSAALLAGTVCAAFDFPLRLPAISYLYVTVLALLAVALSGKEVEHQRPR
jgi:O-antigen ligase